MNALCPGAIRTPMIDDARRQGVISEEALLAMEPVGCLGTPEEMAETAAWLCSDRASFVTGHAMAADGGMVAA